MKDMKDKTQPRAFRITEETANKFKEISAELGENQQQTLAKLIEVYEIERGKEVIPEMREQIDMFDSYLRALSNSYLQILESNHTMRAQVRTEFQAQLGSKDQMIIDLQTRVKTAEEMRDQFLKKEKGYMDDLAAKEKDLQSIQKELEKAQKEIQTTEKMYLGKVDQLKSDIENLKTAEADVRSTLVTVMDENQTLRQKVNESNEKFREQDVHIFQLGRENEKYRSELEKLSVLSENHEKELEIALKNNDMRHELELQKLENKLNAQFRERESKLREELDKYRELYYQAAAKQAQTEEKDNKAKA